MATWWITTGCSHMEVTEARYCERATLCHRWGLLRGFFTFVWDDIAPGAELLPERSAGAAFSASLASGRVTENAIASKIKATEAQGSTLDGIIRKLRIDVDRNYLIFYRTRTK